MIKRRMKEGVGEEPIFFDWNVWGSNVNRLRVMRRYFGNSANRVEAIAVVLL